MRNSLFAISTVLSVRKVSVIWAQKSYDWSSGSCSCGPCQASRDALSQALLSSFRQRYQELFSIWSHSGPHLIRSVSLIHSSGSGYPYVVVGTSLSLATFDRWSYARTASTLLPTRHWSAGGKGQVCVFKNSCCYYLSPMTTSICRDSHPTVCCTVTLRYGWPCLYWACSAS